MSRFYVTFSTRYRAEVHPVSTDVDPGGYVVIEAANFAEAQSRAYEVFNAYYDDLIAEDVFDTSAFPLGELYAV